MWTSDATDFLVDKRAFMDQEVFDRERRYIFSRAWLYVGHDWEYANLALTSRETLGRTHCSSIVIAMA